jgi:iron complex outermembrane recepter protein
VPQAIDYISADQLDSQNIETVEQLFRASPSLQSSGAFGGVRARGVGGVPITTTAESAVGVVLDGVSLGGLAGGSTSLFDVQRVEVLLGPQGTLFGRNSSAGVINIVTRAPDPSAFDASMHYQVGDRDDSVMRGMFNMPLAESIALRMTGHVTKAPHTVYDKGMQQWNQKTTTGGRMRLLYQPSDAVELNLIGDLNHTESTDDTGLTFIDAGVFTSTFNACGVTPGPQNQDACLNKPGYAKDDNSGLSFQADVHLGDYTLTSLSANRWSRGSFDFDEDRTNAGPITPNPSHSVKENFSQEVRLNSPSSELVEYVTGLYYSDGTLDGSNMTPVVSHGRITSLAGFGQATVKATDALHVILGARLEQAEVSARSTDTSNPANSFEQEDQDTDFSWRAGLQTRVTRDIQTYVSYVRGYKGAAINDLALVSNPPPAGVDPVVRPEIPKVWEAGVKSVWLDGKLALNGSVFHIDLEDYQASFLIPSGSSISVVNGNVPSARSQGAELSVLGSVMENFSVKAGVTYTDTAYGEGYTVGGCPAGSSPRCQSTSSGATFYDAEGEPFTFVSKWKGLLSGAYSTAVTETFDGYAEADVSYGSRWRTTVFDPKTTRSDQTLLGARIGMRTRNDRFGISLYGRNLLDQFRGTPLRIAPPFVPYVQILNADTRRSFGLEMDIRFY